MSDISQAVEQADVADSLVADQPTEQPVEGVEQPETLQQDQPTVQAEGELQTDETAEDWLPSDQDKVFPDEVYARYAERYGWSAEEAADPRLRQILHDKINSDIFIRQQQETEQFQEPEQEQVEPQTQPQLPTREQYFAQIDRMIQERTDPAVAKEFHDGFLKAFGIPDAEIAKMPPQQAQQFTSLMSRFGLNLINTFFGDILQSQLMPQLTQALPGFDQMYERSAYAMAWDSIRNSSPQYASLPAYGTKEFSQTLRQAESRFPEIVAAFQGADGKIPTAKAAAAYGILAKLATGQNVDPALVQRAAAAGARSARRADVRRSAGNLGSGQSTSAQGQTRGSSKFQTNTDLFDDETMNIWQREHGRI